MKMKATLVLTMTLGSLLESGVAAAQDRPLPNVPAGEIVRVEPFDSGRVPPRAVDVWLPPGYDGERPHAVVYMHDGEVLFDATQSWNGMSWDAAGVSARLIEAGDTRPFIIVAIPNAGAERWAEYTPAPVRCDARRRSRALRGDPP